MKNFKGGYKIISLQGNDLASLSHLDGIYEAIAESYEKPLLVTGIVISGEKKNDVFTTATVDGTSYQFEVYGKVITIEEDGDISVGPLEDPIGYLDLSAYTITTDGISISDDEWNALYNSVKDKKVICVTKPFKIKISSTDYLFTPSKQNVTGYVNASGFQLDINGSYEQYGTTYATYRFVMGGGPRKLKYESIPTYGRLNCISISAESGTLSADNLDLVKNKAKGPNGVIIYNSNNHYIYHYAKGKAMGDMYHRFTAVVRQASSTEYSTIKISDSDGTYTTENKTVSD